MKNPILSKIQNQANELKAQIENLKKEAANLVKPMLMEFLEENPEVRGLAWVQYTPYFNDGDECVFRMGDTTFYWYGEDYEELEVGEEAYEGLYHHESSACSADTYKNCREFSSILESLEDEMKLLFNDHVTVKVTRDGVEVEEYDHD